MEKVSFITTVFNESSSICAFLDSILTQVRKPDEVVIVDAGSTDGTYEAMQEAIPQFQKAGISYNVKQASGNRSVGRNSAIRASSHSWIAVSDAGCTLDPHWLKNLFSTECPDPDVISGFYSSDIANPTPSQKALAAYTCVMPDQLNEQTFLPSSRSIAFTRYAWSSVGGYPEELDTCEDLVFAQRLKKAGKKFCMAADALVYWPQNRTLYEAAKQFYGYAYGDGQAGYMRPQTPLLFGRYILGAILVIWAMRAQSPILWMLIGALLLGYTLWAIKKNYRYVSSWHAFYLLPALQFTADFAVMLGMKHGYISRITHSRTIDER